MALLHPYIAVGSGDLSMDPVCQTIPLPSKGLKSFLQESVSV